MRTLAPQRASWLSIDNWLGVSTTSQSLDPISAIRSVSIANSCKDCMIFTWIALSEYYDMWVAQWITTFSTRRRCQFYSRGIHKADRRSTSRFVFSLGSKAISSSCKKQPTIGLSNIEAEYRSTTMAACEVVWPKRILKDLGVPMKDLTPLFCDNMSNIYLFRNTVFHAYKAYRSALSLPSRASFDWRCRPPTH